MCSNMVPILRYFMYGHADNLSVVEEIELVFFYK